MLKAIGKEVDVKDRDVPINIRADETTLYEADDGTLLVEEDDTLFELSMTANGIVATETVFMGDSLEVLEPAEREEDEVDDGGITSVTREVMD